MAILPDRYIRPGGDDEPDLFSPPPPRQRHSETSCEAADLIADRTATMRARVYEAILEAGEAGLTDEEGMGVIGLAGNCYRPRRVELVRAGRVHDSRRTRTTASGRRAVVWTAIVVNSAEK